MSARARLPCPATLRALLAGAALAVGLSTLAGGGAMRAWIRAGLPAAGEAHPPRAPAAVDSSPLAPGISPAPRTRSTPSMADPAPYAPGGDDLLPTPERHATRPQAAATLPTAAAVPSATAAPRASSAAGGWGPALSLVLWLEHARVPSGEHPLLYVAATGADTCRGLDLLDGQVLANGRNPLPAQAPGRHRLGVRCSGAGAVVERRLLLIVPWPVLGSSVLNSAQVDFDLDRQPTLHQLGLADAAIEVQTAADFMQEGRQARWVLASSADGGGVFVLARNDSGVWTDRSAELLDAADRRSCAMPTQALTVDFNRDGRPDVLVTCRGASAGGERQLLFLSQPDGRYRRVETGFALPVARAEALDIDGDGWIDVRANVADSDATLWLRGRAPGVLDYGLK